MHNESQVQNKKWNDVAPLVNSEGKLRYSCVCGKEIKSRNTFNRHVESCIQYKEKACKVGYMVKCALCSHIGHTLISHIKKNHPDVSLEEYIEKYPKSLKSDFYNIESVDKLKKSGERRRVSGEAKRRAAKIDGGAILCRMCNEPLHQILPHLRQVHQLTREQYLEQYPDAELLSESFSRMAVERGKKNGNWISRANEAGEDLTEYKKKMGSALSNSIMSNKKERARRSSLMKDMWTEPDKKIIFIETARRTAIKTSARKDIQEARAERLRAWRIMNPSTFYEKCTKVMHSKWSSVPEKKLRDFCQGLNPNFLWNQQIKSKEHFNVNKTNSKQIDLIDKTAKIIIELDGPHHFKPIHGQENLLKNKKKDLELNQYCVDNNYILIRVSYSEYLYKPSVKNFNQACLSKIKEILQNNIPGVYKIGKEYGE